MALSEFYELRVSGTIQGVEWLNVFHLKRIEPGAGAFNVVQAFEESILPLWLLTVPTTVLFEQVECENLDDPLDFNSQSLTGQVGARIGTLLPRFNSLQIPFPRQRTDMRQGMKRFAGVNEEDQANGLIVAGLETLLVNLGDALIVFWVETVIGVPTDVCEYHIIKRIKYTTPGGTIAYRLPETDAELVSYAAIAHSASRTITSQVSRK